MSSSPFQEDFSSLPALLTTWTSRAVFPIPGTTEGFLIVRLPLGQQPGAQPLSKRSRTVVRKCATGLLADPHNDAGNDRIDLRRRNLHPCHLEALRTSEAKVHPGGSRLVQVALKILLVKHRWIDHLLPQRFTLALRALLSLSMLRLRFRLEACSRGLATAWCQEIADLQAITPLLSRAGGAGCARSPGGLLR